jgi:hypothetical protein
VARGCDPAPEGLDEAGQRVVGSEDEFRRLHAAVKRQRQSSGDEPLPQAAPPERRIDRHCDLHGARRVGRVRLGQSDHAVAGVEGSYENRAGRIDPAYVCDDRSVGTIAEQAGAPIRRPELHQVPFNSGQVACAELAHTKPGESDCNLSRRDRSCSRFGSRSNAEALLKRDGRHGTILLRAGSALEGQLPQ